MGTFSRDLRASPAKQGESRFAECNRWAGCAKRHSQDPLAEASYGPHRSRRANRNPTQYASRTLCCSHRASLMLVQRHEHDIGRRTAAALRNEFRRQCKAAPGAGIGSDVVRPARSSRANAAAWDRRARSDKFGTSGRGRSTSERRQPCFFRTRRCWPLPMCPLGPTAFRRGLKDALRVEADRFKGHARTQSRGGERGAERNRGPLAAAQGAKAGCRRDWCERRGWEDRKR